MDKFRIGDIVYHLSNINQCMVVISTPQTEILHTFTYSCRWINKDGIVCVGDFIKEEIELYQDIIDYLDTNNKK